MTKLQSIFKEGFIKDSQPAVTFALTYKNEGQEAKSCEVAVDVELASRETDGFERTFRTKTFKFDLRPGRSHTIKGSLDAYQDLSVHPRLSLRLSLKP